MKPIKARVLCSYNGIWYDKGDEIKVETKEDLVRLNEKGFIEPLTLKEINEIEKFINKPRNKKEEE